jgi:predicted TIM-barrel fold metal-dependent hydrolase
MPTVYEVIGDAGYIAGYQKVGEGAATKYINNFHYVVKKNNAGKWQIASEVFTVDPPRVPKALTADQLIKDLDAAGIKRGVVLSVAYMFGSAFRKPPEDEYAKVRAENDWIAEQVARYQDRLVGFCSFNPLKDYAIEELNRCAMNPRFKGVKLHLGNSGVDIRQNPQHVEKIRQIFRLANEKRLAIVIHFWTSPAYETEGGDHARVFLNQILPEAPDITVQIAHMAGGGRSTDTAMEVFANAIVAGDRRTKNLYFDIATLTGGQTDEGLRKDAQRMRQIGLKRILYGTDGPPNPPARQSWELFRTRVPLTAKEFRTIARNIAPYLR